MTSCSRGDVVLVKFIFADETGAKQRPALVLTGNLYHQGRQEAIVAAITSKIQRQLMGDHEIRAWREAGLPLPSLVTGIIRTIKQSIIVRKIGEMAASDFRMVEDNLREILELSPL